MRYSFLERITRSRTLSSLAILAITLSLASSAGVAQARLDQGPTSGAATALIVDAVAKATGGGTVLTGVAPTPNAVASFGLNARRPVDFAGGSSQAEGRVNYDRHSNSAGRHVNAPVVFMEAAPTPMPPNNTGGDALLVANCGAQGAECPTSRNSAIVYVEDNSDSGKAQDRFFIYFCSDQPQPPDPNTFIPGQPIPGFMCDPAEGGLLRSGNIQVRGDAAVAGELIGTAAGSGSYTSTPNVNGVELSGGTFGIGLRTAGPGDLEANLSGVQPLLGLFQQLTVSGWVTSASVNGGTMSFSGTASVDMGDGSAPLTGLSLSGSVTATGVSLTVGSWSFGTLPMQDGFIKIE
jgi:hypothetical protein